MKNGLVALGAAVLMVPVPAPARAAGEPPTFNKDVASILYANCVSCHRPGEIAPMSLLSYEQTRPWARSIKKRVVAREMPPWFADPKFGEFRNGHGLTQPQIDMLAAWVDAGAPQGTGTPPPPPTFAQGWHTFMNRPPDAVVEMPMDFDVPAEGELPIFTLWGPNPFKDDKFMEAVELRPGVITAVHHSDVTARSLPTGTALGRGPAWKGGPLVDFVPMYPNGRSYNELTGAGDRIAGESPADAKARRTAVANEAFRTTDDARLLFYVPGGGFQTFPDGAVKRISSANVLVWGLHYTPTGKPEKDRHRLGLWFAHTPPTHEIVTRRVGQAHIVEGKEFVAGIDGNDFPSIPPFAEDWKITAITALQDDVTLYGMWPHMHLRGKDMMFVATYPDGREEVLLNVPKYDFNWQLQYELVKPAHLPAGSTIKTIGHYDNSIKNKYNPGPDKRVYWSEQSWDEMFNGWIEIAVDKDVIRRPAVYTIVTPINTRVSLRISSGPSGTVHVRSADGSSVTSGPIRAVTSFIEPWTFASGQTITVDASGANTGNVTVMLYDVPPDVTGSVTIGGAAVPVTTTQPGQNGALTFSGTASQQVTVRVTENTMGAVTVRLQSAEGITVFTSSTSAVRSFKLSTVTLPSTGAYTISVDPSSTNTGTLNIRVTSP